MAKYAQTFDALLTSQRAGGVTLAGGKAWFYVPGSVTPKAIYADRNKQTPLSNPVTLSADGTAQVFGDGLYDVEITNSAGVHKFLWEDVKIQDPAGNTHGYVLSDYASLAAAVAAIGSSTNAELTLDANATVTSDLTVPSNIFITVPAGNTINISAGKVLTLGGFNAPLASVFTGTGTVKFAGGGVQTMYPQWWGCKPYFGGVDYTDCSPGLQSAITAARDSGQGSISFVSGSYVFDSPVGFNTTTDLSANIEIKGTGPDSVLVTNFDNDTVESGLLYFTADETAGINLRRISVHDLKINMNLKRGSAIFGRILAASQFYNIWAGGQANDSASTAPTLYFKNCSQLTLTNNVLNHNPNTASLYGGPGIRLHSTAFAVGMGEYRTKSIIANNTFGEQLKTAILVDAEVDSTQGGNTISDNSIYYTYSHAIHLINTDRNTIKGNIIDEAGVGASGGIGIFLDSSSYNVVDGNTLIDAGSPSIKIDGALTVAENAIGNVIRSNSINVSNKATNIGLHIADANCVGTNVSGNVFSGTFAIGSILDSGASSIIKDQYGAPRAAQLSTTVTATAADTTPSVKGYNSLQLLASTNYTMFDDGIDGQLLFVRGATGASITNSATLRLAGASDYATMDSNTTLLFLYFGNAWFEISRNIGTARTFATAAPTTGTHAVGKIVWNSAPASAGKIGWVCTVAGTPGTWKTFGTID